MLTLQVKVKKDIESAFSVFKPFLIKIRYKVMNQKK